MLHDATIFALASAAGRGGVAVFRISGAHAVGAVSKLCRPSDVPPARQALLRKIHHPETGEPIDEALLLYFQAPHSFTGEDVVELHTHGGRAITNAVIEALRSLEHFRLAEPGEFTRRAFENGKMDLTEAEAIADLVDAETEAQRRQALRQYEGALGKIYEDWRGQLTRSLAYLEAAIDFSDEELPEDIAAKQMKALQELATDIDQHLQDGHRGERLRDGFHVAILGAPNAGKSSLLNALARRDAAIVSSIAGTTRDVIEVHLDIGGYPVVLADTAGLRESVDAIENEGIRRALQRAERADLKLLVFDATAAKLDDATLALVDHDAVVVLNKGDLGGRQHIEFSIEENVVNSEARKPTPMLISSQTGEGIPALLDHVMNEIDRRFTGSGQTPLTRARHRAALEECSQHLQRALAASQSELLAEDVRLAMRSLGRITGRIDVEDLLDVIFRDFCIGK
jgi:tRNA modification GTPase